MGDLTPREHGALAPVPDRVGFAGRPVDYTDLAYTSEEAWVRLASGTRQWAEEHAGAPIRDPHTGAPTVYWRCVLHPEAGGPRGAGVKATYDLVLFGRRGLVVSKGTTANFVDAPGATSWHNERYALTVDESSVRSDHRTEAAAHAVVGQPPRAPRGTGNVLLLPDHESRLFGNLPAPTQAFLFEPFASSTAAPVAGVLATIQTVGMSVVETFWAYVFNRRSVAFAHATRRVPDRSRAVGSGRWNDAPERRALDQAPWAVAAWVARTATPGAELASRREPGS